MSKATKATRESKIIEFFALIDSPSIAMKEAGSIASNYDLSQVDVEKIWRAMADQMIYDLSCKD